MFGQLKLSFQMTVAAFKMTMRYPQTLLVALANLVFLVAVAVAPLLVIFSLVDNNADAAYAIWKYYYQWWIVDSSFARDASGNLDWSSTDPGGVFSAFLLWGLVVYFLWCVVVTFGALITTTIIMHTGVQQLRGQKPSIADGARLAGQNLLRLLGLAIVAGFILAATKRLLAVLRVVPFVGKWIRNAVIGALTFTLYLVLPIVVYERAGPWSAFKNVWTNLRKTWGGMIVGTGLIIMATWVGLWVVQTAFWSVVGANIGDPVVWSTMLTIQVIAAVALYCLNLALAANLRAALYLHVVEGHTGVLPAGVLEKKATPTPPAPARL